jgi:D-alanyl-D-alanine carboxypeptidase
MKIASYKRRIAALHESLGIPSNYARTHCLPVQAEAQKLVSIDPDIYEREQRLIPQAAAAWCRMRDSAGADGIVLQVVSAFRSVDYQEGILRRKLEKGETIDDILCVSAAPGYSEHHSGCALDLCTPGFPVLEEEFEDSEAFAWLTGNAAGFGFHLSFPRDNPHGVIYEPWHWTWRKKN